MTEQPVPAKKRSRSSSSPTKRSLALLRSRGMVAEKTEHWVPHTKRTRDLFTWIDVLAMDPATGEFLAVQTTSSANVAARLDKIHAWPHLEAFLLRHRAVVHGWAKKGKRGERKLWHCREIVVELPSESATLQAV